MKILLMGANGQLGHEIQRQNHSFELHGLTHAKLDITDYHAVKAAIADIQPHIVINAAAYTAVDKAETEPDLAFAINRDGPENLARCCARQKTALIHISSDFVFDGKKTAPYMENDPTAPLSVYGRSKADGEQAIVPVLQEHIIVRTSWLYGFYGQNFVKTMLKLGKEKEVISVVADQQGSPTCAEDLAEVILTLAGRLQFSLASNSPDPPWGIYHYCGEGITTWHGFAIKIFEIAAQLKSCKIPQVTAVNTSGYRTLASRPAYSVLDCGLIRQKFGIGQKPWRESLKRTLSRVLSATPQDS